MDLPDELRLGGYSDEFAELPNDAELESYEYLKLLRGQFGPQPDSADDGWGGDA